MSLNVGDLKLSAETAADIIEAITVVVNTAAQQTRDELRGELNAVKGDLRLVKKHVAKLTNSRAGKKTA